MAYRKKRYGRSGAPRQKTAQEPESMAMQALLKQTSEIEANAGHDRGFTPKPRAIRKYERFANMGE